MLLRRTSLAVVASIALLLVVTTIGAAQGGSTLLRFVHVVPGADPIDVYVDGDLAIADLEYGEASSYINAPAGDRVILAAASGSDAVLWEQTVSAPDGSVLSLIASSSDPLLFTRFTEDLNPIALGKARFTAIHAIAGAPDVDVTLGDGRPVAPGLSYMLPYGTLDLPSMNYAMDVRVAGDADTILIPGATVSLDGGTSNILLVHGTPDAPEVTVLSAPTRAASPESGGLRFAHLVEAAPEVEIALDETVIVPSLVFGEVSPLTPIADGSYNVVARLVGSTEPLDEIDVVVESGKVLTLYVTQVSGENRILIMVEDVSGISDSTAIVSVVNIAGEDVVVNAADSSGNALATDLANTGSAFAAISASDDAIEISAAQGDASVDATLDGGLYGGTLNSIVVIAGASGEPVIVELPSAALAQSIASAPIEGLAVAATPAMIPTNTVEATPVPTEAPAAPPTAVPTEAPAAAPTEVPTQAPTTPTARVLLNPGANLQLRLYPSAEAFSLGLAPSGSTFIVNGRAGEPAPLPGATPDPEAEEFIDPATELEEDEDLDPAETWLYVTYGTPDGGAVNAWVNALYLSVTSVRGTAQRLADLPTIPSNRAGAALDTAITPPTAADRTVSAFTGNVASGARVHLRRLPDITSESLALLDGGVRVALIGLNEDRDWVYVRFDDGAGTVTTGWISALYITGYERLGQVVTLERVEELGELVILTGEERGDVVTGVPPTAAVDPALRNQFVGEVINLNIGANLHLRRFDDNAAESLALLSGGTTFIVEGQNFDGTWLRVTYQGTTGWVFAQFVELSRNGLIVSLEDIPVIEEIILTPTATPEGE